jgi:hypothetical protein
MVLRAKREIALESSTQNQRIRPSRMRAHRTTQPISRIALAMFAGLFLLVATGVIHDACADSPDGSAEAGHELLMVCQCACHQHMAALTGVPQLLFGEAASDPISVYESPCPSIVTLGIFRPPRFLA